MTLIEALRENIGIVIIACISGGMALGLYIARPGTELTETEQEEQL